MEKPKKQKDNSLQRALEMEDKKFEECYLWLRSSMSPTFFEEVEEEDLLLIAHNLVALPQQDFFSTIHLKRGSIVLCLDGPDADLRILKGFAYYGIRNYHVYVSREPLLYLKKEEKLRIAILHYTQVDKEEEPNEPEDFLLKDELKNLVMQRNPQLTEDEFQQLIAGISNRFLKTTPKEQLILALDMFFRAKTRDNCQYEVRYDELWEEDDRPSMQIVLAWRNTPKHHFLYRLARVINRNGLAMRRVSAHYIDPYGRQSILVMVLSLHGIDGRAAWEVADIPDFLRELMTVKYFSSFDEIDRHLVSRDVIGGSMGNFLRASSNFIHQMLAIADPNLYSISHIEEAFCSHPELTIKFCEMFSAKFEPNHHDIEKFRKLKKEFLRLVNKLDTGQERADLRRRTILQQAANFLEHLLKTNFYRYNYTAISFRLDPALLKYLPYDTLELFPVEPFAIFFVKGMHFVGFHIRFEDLARGGLRTVYPRSLRESEEERGRVFAECYHLALTQHKKNKDIPEGGSKGVIFLRPFERIASETAILEHELENTDLSREEVDERLAQFQDAQRIEHLHQAQRSYVEAFITLLNCDPDGTLRAKNIVDYWKRPEYIYIGPDENMHDEMMQWIARYSKKYGYKPAGSFITGKPQTGISHKKYGVTSLGVNVFMHHTLEFLGINPKEQTFTIKMTGGPDGDVAGNQIKNLYYSYGDNAKIVALTDGTGTVFDSEGLDLKTLVGMFDRVEGIRFYPPEKLSEGSFLLDKQKKRQHTAFAQQTLCYRKKDGKVTKDWLSGSDMNALLRMNVHTTPADIFIPAGGRPRTLHANNVTDFLDETGKPTARAIIEGANLYLTPRARSFLEERGVLIVKDSTANKTGVVCSSYEVLAGLTLGDKEFEHSRSQLISEILYKLEKCAYYEALLLLDTHKKTGEPLTVLSDKISDRINQYTYEILSYLDPRPFPEEESHPLVQCYLHYTLPLLSEQYKNKLMEEIPDHHKKAVIACFLASRVVYRRGLDWAPTIVETLPLIQSDTSLLVD